LCGLLLLVDVKIDIEIVVEFIEFVNAQFLQNLINQMHEQSFYLLHCNIFLLQPQFQMLYEKSTSNYNNCKNYSMRLHKNLTSNYSNPILDYLSIIETGARVGTGDDEDG
jgi:GTP-sensing pleiotropic transcriptional regulator CodY